MILAVRLSLTSSSLAMTDGTQHQRSEALIRSTATTMAPKTVCVVLCGKHMNPSLPTDFDHNRTMDAKCTGIDLRNNTAVVENQNGQYVLHACPRCSISTAQVLDVLLHGVHHIADQQLRGRGRSDVHLYVITLLSIHATDVLQMLRIRCALCVISGESDCVSAQAMHAPLEVPQSYIDNTDCAGIPESNRRVFCGMMKALDEVCGCCMSLSVLLTWCTGHRQHHECAAGQGAAGRHSHYLHGCMSI